MGELAAMAAAVAMMSGVHAVARRLDTVLAGVPRRRWLSIAGGVSVAYVFVHLLPEIAAAQRELDEAGALRGDVSRELWLGALAGVVVFYGLERLIDRRTETGHRSAHDVTGWLHLGSYAVFNAIVGYLLVEQAERGATHLWLYAISITVHLIVNDHALVEHHGDLYRRRGRWVLAGAVIAGWGLAMAGSLGPAVVPALLAFIGGGVVLNVMKEELPEERQGRFVSFAAAATGYAALLIAI